MVRLSDIYYTAVLLTILIHTYRSFNLPMTYYASPVVAGKLILWTKMQNENNRPFYVHFWEKTAWLELASFKGKRSKSAALKFNHVLVVLGWGVGEMVRH